jgi:hypothetical protein
MDFAEPNSLIINHSLPKKVKFHQLRFRLGIDSAINMAGALGGPLDPTTGMYWTWQSGFINIKIEGKMTSSSEVEQPFVFHLGGYKHPFPSIQQISLDLKDGSFIQIGIDLKQFIERINSTKVNHIMSPGAEAVQLSERFAKSFMVLP